MVVDERARHELHQRLESVLGREEAATLMSYLPPVGWADVATKRDLDLLGVATKRDVELLRQELAALAAATRQDIDDVRQRMEALAASTERDIAALAASTERDIGALAASTERDIEILGDRLRAEFYKSQNSQTRTLVFSVVSAMLMLATLAFGAASLV